VAAQQGGPKGKQSGGEETFHQAISLVILGWLATA
jgi:hypothetical protein